MTGSIVVALWLAAAEPAVPPPVETPSVPDASIVLGLRQARIAAQLGDVANQREILDALVAAHPDDPTTVGAALTFHRDADGETEATRALRVKLLDALARPGVNLPLPLILDIARDPKTAPAELTRLADRLAAQPGTGADRVARLRIRLALLDRLGRRDDALAALEELTTIDGDPALTSRLVRVSLDAGRWEEVLRVTGRIKGADTGVEVGWWRIEALAALGRYDELSSESEAFITRLKGGSTLEAYQAELFFPTIFLLVDNGRLEPATRLVDQLQQVAPDVESVKRLRVMLFGTPEARVAYLDAVAGASLASADPEKIRTEAYQRLLGKDYVTAHDLYRRLFQLDPGVALVDSSDWFNYGLASIESQAWADAEVAMTNVIDGAPPNARAFAHRGRARIMLGRTAEGMKDAESALAIDPKSRQACYAMYLAYQKFGNTEQAAAWLARSKAP